MAGAKQRDMTSAQRRGRRDDEPRRRVPWSRLLSRPVQYVLDVLVLSAALLAAYLLRFEFHISDFYRKALEVQLPFVVLVQFAALNVFGVYSFVWRYIGLAEIKQFVKAAFWSFLPLLLLRLALPEPLGHWRLPRCAVSRRRRVSCRTSAAWNCRCRNCLPNCFTPPPSCCAPTASNIRRPPSKCGTACATSMTKAPAVSGR